MKRMTVKIRISRLHDADQSFQKLKRPFLDAAHLSEGNKGFIEYQHGCQKKCKSYPYIAILKRIRLII